MNLTDETLFRLPLRQVEQFRDWGHISVQRFERYYHRWLNESSRFGNYRPCRCEKCTGEPAEPEDPIMTDQELDYRWDKTAARECFLPPGPCMRCGKMLRGMYSGYPAETYMGTFTGLCYPCTSEPSYALDYEEVSGAKVYSHAPHSPAWRRDRRTFYGFDGCETCKGRGRVEVYQSLSMGGSYPTQCKICQERHYAHPLVQKIHVLAKKLGEVCLVYGRHLNAEYQRRLRARGVPEWDGKGQHAEWAKPYQATIDKTAEEIRREAPPAPTWGSMELPTFPLGWAVPELKGKKKPKRIPSVTKKRESAGFFA